MSRITIRFLAIFACAWSAIGQTPGTLSVLSEELNRNFTALKKTDPAPYFISYAVTDQDYAAVSASSASIPEQDVLLIMSGLNPFPSTSRRSR